MITLVGDIHGDFGVLKQVRNSRPGVVIQVGDLGYWPWLIQRWPQLDNQVLFIEGNHDYLPSLINLTEPTEVWPSLVYVPRGTVLTLDNKRIGFLGGANSIDRAWRVENSPLHGWYAEEELLDSDIDKLLANKPDIIIAHAAPARTVAKYFDPDVPRDMFGHDNWYDPSAHRLDRLAATGIPYYCGHMHRAVTDDNVRILDINEVLEV